MPSLSATSSGKFSLTAPPVGVTGHPPPWAPELSQRSYHGPGHCVRHWLVGSIDPLTLSLTSSPLPVQHHTWGLAKQVPNKQVETKQVNRDRVQVKVTEGIREGKPSCTLSQALEVGGTQSSGGLGGPHMRQGLPVGGWGFPRGSEV